MALPVFENEFLVQQPPGPIYVQTGEVLTLECEVTEESPPGPVKWFKGEGESRKLIFPVDRSPHKAKRRARYSTTDFTIFLPNVVPEDAGIYYCVKLKKLFREEEEDFQSGHGTEVFVDTQPFQPMIISPACRVDSGDVATFNCWSRGFPSQDIRVTWTKKQNQIEALPPTITSENTTYRVTSSVQVPLEEKDIYSTLIRNIDFSSSERPLQQSFDLRGILRDTKSWYQQKEDKTLLSSTLMAASSSFSKLPCVFLLFSLLLAVFAGPSQPIITPRLSRVASGATATFTCQATRFNSEDITVTWIKDGNKIEALPPIITPEQTTYRMKSTVHVPLTEKDFNSTLTCHIEHSISSESPIQQSYDLRDVLRVAPQVTVETSLSSPIPLNQSVRLTCVVNNFYPNNITVAWWRSDYRNFTQRADNGNRNVNGTYFIRLPLSTRKSRRSATNYTCKVIHASQSPVYVSRVLNFGTQPEENGNACVIESGLFLLSNPGLWIGLLVGKTVVALLILFLLLRKLAKTFSALTKTKKDLTK
ncbi:signal-regulatory protein beta-1-like [Eublepharis macularius]|uniref:Signal-regulatory protein beta-1-like n=1 Tax=Eublepharis macularius TaxID=481883 RepID=A0AA97JFK7_EUBMA|nr:signal-regulatory protein beta-1-like [Eublepharis macularius]